MDTSGTGEAVDRSSGPEDQCEKGASSRLHYLFTSRVLELQGEIESLRVQEYENTESKLD